MKTRKLLYIEDNFHNRRIVRKIMERQGYEIHEAEDGLVGFEMIEELKPPLVLLDISLPGMDGIEIARRVKADPRLNHILLIALTASAMQGDRERFLEAGCDDYMSKPFKALALVDMVNNHFDEIEARPAKASVPQITPSEAHAPVRETPRRPVDIDTVRPSTRITEPEVEIPADTLEDPQPQAAELPVEIEAMEESAAAVEEAEAVIEPEEVVEPAVEQEEPPAPADESVEDAAAPAEMLAEEEVAVDQSEAVAEKALPEAEGTLPEAEEAKPEIEPAPARSDDEPLVWLPESKLDLDGGQTEPAEETGEAVEDDDALMEFEAQETEPVAAAVEAEVEPEVVEDDDALMEFEVQEAEPVAAVVEADAEAEAEPEAADDVLMEFEAQEAEPVAAAVEAEVEPEVVEDDDALMEFEAQEAEPVAAVVEVEAEPEGVEDDDALMEFEAQEDEPVAAAVEAEPELAEEEVVLMELEAQEAEPVTAAVEVEVEAEPEGAEIPVDVVTKIHTAPLEPSAVDGKEQKNGSEEKEVDFTKLSRRDRNQQITENILEMINPEMLRPVDPNAAQDQEEK